jgi:hypothetical protein
MMSRIQFEVENMLRVSVAGAPTAIRGQNYEESAAASTEATRLMIAAWQSMLRTESRGIL